MWWIRLRISEKYLQGRLINPHLQRELDNEEKEKDEDFGSGGRF